ncbi:uncharacterized protein LOC132723132 isoform X2 [Ruditapes philippinarum]|uniref:uncharacterized protein LOC132723132 isoform X2 n=1 Tax=Ruditapes philippinarum TaxID=129788 RepID=UPI00295B80F5|nr:uncharacterized protein LOC132723132 isoform X2 [Ruditapes philippinarum]
MELQTSTMVAVFVACMVVTQSLAIPISSADDGTSLSADKRPKYMETRDLKDMLMYALEELIAEGKVNPNVLLESEDTMIENKTEKRGRHLGICLRVSPSGSYIPRPCWRREGRLRR